MCSSAKQRILVALSGGVDSAVAALLLKQQGHDVEGVFMRTWQNEEQNVFGQCPWEIERESARQVAQYLGIPFRVLNMIEHYRTHVVNPLIQGYAQGTTPNPDIFCNREIKFGHLLDYTLKEHFDGLATGHYCRIDQQQLYRGIDKNKDQSYFLAMIKKESLPFLHFPLGNLTKPQVREIAKANHLPNADKKDSQGICFLGKVKIQSFLKAYLPPQPGLIYSQSGAVLGTHTGLCNFTLGQRKGLKIPSNCDHEHYVVVAKKPEDQSLIVNFESQAKSLYQKQFQIKDLNAFTEIFQGDYWGIPRYRDPIVRFHWTTSSKTTGSIEFTKPQRSLSPGQILAFYSEQGQLLGGGVFDV